jgi:hypothetical protein
MEWIENLKIRWGIESNWRLAKIFFIFSITGMTAVQLRKLVFPLIGIDSDTPTWLFIIVWILLITPSYYFFMIIYSIVFGEKKFFFGIMNKTLSRFKRKK